MAKVYKPGEGRKLARAVKKGDVLYTIIDVAQNVAPYEDSQLYGRHVVSWTSPVTGNPMISGSMSVEALCLRYGPVYTEPPKGLRNISEPGPQVAGPLPEGYEAVLDEAELRGLEKQVRDGSDPRTRRRLGTWRA